MQKTGFIKRSLAILLCLLMVLSTVPTAVFAEEIAGGEGTSEYTDATGVTDTTDATDATDSTDPADVTDPTDATDSTDVTDPTDATDSTDATDPTDNTDTTESEDEIDLTSLDADVTDWANLTEFAEGEVYYIASADDLGAFRDLVNAGNNGSGCTFILSSDIDLSGVCSEEIGSWVAIGPKKKTSFSGTFDGNGYKIKNLYVAASASRGSGGLFQYINKATIKNLTLYGTVSNSKGKIGAFTSDAIESNFENCVNYAAVSGDQAAAFAAQADGVFIANCVNCADMSGASSAGIVGNAEGSSFTIKDCTNYGTISVPMNKVVAGIICYATAPGSVENCVNEGDIVSSGGDAGGITCSTSRVTISNCTNKGKISGFHASGIGYAKTFSNCTNYGNVTATDAIAGGISQSSTGATFTNCKNYGTIISNSAGGGTGGIVGQVYTKSTISNCENYGEIVLLYA